MIIKDYKTITLDNLHIDISIVLKDSTEEMCMNYYYSCPKCNGRGCGSHSNEECSSGTIFKALDLSKLDETFFPDDADKIRMLISKINAQCNIRMLSKKEPVSI